MKIDFNDLSEIDRTACEWVSIINSDGATDDELVRFEEWLRADPAHAEAFAHYEALFADIAELKDLEYLVEPAATGKPAGFTDHLVAAVRAAFARPLLPVATMAAVMALAVAGVVLLRQPSPPQSYVTRIAETRDVALPDGSVLTLGARSSAEVDFEKNVRKVSLLKGQAFFDVASDPARPFIVQAGDAAVEVVGTRFDVKLVEQETHIAVVEGLVSVRESTGRAGEAKLPAGEAVSVSSGEISQTHSVGADAIEAWRAGRLVYDNAPLREVVADINRYASRPLALASSVDGGLTVTGAFTASDVNGVIRALAATHDLEVVPDLEGVRILQPKKQ